MAAAPLNPTVSETAAAAARWRRVVSDANHRLTLSFDVLLVRIPFVDGPAHAGASHVHRPLGALSSSPVGRFRRSSRMARGRHCWSPASRSPRRPAPHFPGLGHPQARP